MKHRNGSNFEKANAARLRKVVLAQLGALVLEILRERAVVDTLRPARVAFRVEAAARSLGLLGEEAKP